MLTLPAREAFPKIKMFFKQSDPILGHDAKMRIRSHAKKVRELYSLSVKTNPPAIGRNDNGNEIKVGTLGKWLFGVPGYKGHITVIPAESTLEILIYTEETEATELIRQAAERQGLKLIYTANKNGQIGSPYGTMISAIVDKWDQVKESLTLCGDIGNFDPEDYILLENKVGFWTGEKNPIAWSELMEFVEAKLHNQNELNTIAAQALYSNIATVAIQRLIPDIEYITATIFGEFYGQIVSGWSGRFDNLDEETEMLKSIFAENGTISLAWAETGYSWFNEEWTQKRLNIVFEHIRKGKEK